MNEVIEVSNKHQLKEWMRVLQYIIDGSAHHEQGMGWWFHPWDLGYCEKVLYQLLFEPSGDTTGIALYTPNAVAAGILGPHFLSPSLIWCEEYICRSLHEGKKIRAAFVDLAKNKGAHVVVCDNVPDCILDQKRSADIMKALGYKVFSTRYIHV